MPEEPRTYEELVDALKDHPEWRHNLRELLGDEQEPGGAAPPPPSHRSKAWIPTLGMGVLLGAIIAGVVAFVILNDGDDDDPTVAAAAEQSPSPSASPATSPGLSPTPARSATVASPTPVPTTAAPASPAPTTPPAPSPTPTPVPQTTSAPPPTQPPAPTAVPTAPPSGSPTFAFGGFEGACAPVSAVVVVQNLTQPVTMAATWTGPTFINVGPLTLQPTDPGATTTVRFPTVAPLTPGQYTFTATANGAVIVVESMNITC